MKVCFRCKNEKDYEYFTKNKRNKDGYETYCKECRKEIYLYGNVKATTVLDDESIIQRKIERAKYYMENRDKYSKKSKKYNEKNKEKIKEQRKNYYEKNKDDINSKKKNNYEKNREKILKQKKEYGKKNRNKINSYIRNKIKTCPLFKLKTNLRSLIRGSFSKCGLSKKSKTVQILGCSFEEFKIYLESKFEPWMTWENRGLFNNTLNYGWDIDHIIPLSSANTAEDIIKLNHYTNLQPLCSYTNRYIKKDNLK